MLRYVSDYHTHTYISGDSKSTLMENARAARAAEHLELESIREYNRP